MCYISRSYLAGVTATKLWQTCHSNLTQLTIQYVYKTIPNGHFSKQDFFYPSPGRPFRKKMIASHPRYLKSLMVKEVWTKRYLTRVCDVAVNRTRRVMILNLTTMGTRMQPVCKNISNKRKFRQIGVIKHVCVTSQYCNELIQCKQ